MKDYEELTISILSRNCFIHRNSFQFSRFYIYMNFVSLFFFFEIMKYNNALQFLLRERDDIISKIWQYLSTTWQ